MPIKAVVFDIGGVVVHSPLEGIRKFERSIGLPENYLNARGEKGAFQRLERAELSLRDFYDQFGREVSDPINLTHYATYLQSKGRNVPPTLTPPKINGKDLFSAMMKESETIDPVVIEAIKRIKASNRYKLAALTNNFQYTDDETVGQPPVHVISALFDHYIESSVVGLRKPDPNFFLHACKVLGVQPTEVVFLDDIGM
ncbi:hypothetical protein HDU67_001968 [Dinochytrium kinnereticum]|nr:hypothetical protein HDU67_001968 [Dinochytrium kinnereticum]